MKTLLSNTYAGDRRVRSMRPAWNRLKKFGFLPSAAAGAAGAAAGAAGGVVVAVSSDCAVVVAAFNGVETVRDAEE